MPEHGAPQIDVVFLDAGGVLVSPDPARIAARFAAAGITVDPAQLVGAHYRGVHAIDRAAAAPEEFADYHDAYARHLGLVDDDLARGIEILEGLWERSGLWTAPLPWAADGLAAIAATGIPIVIVSNADGTVATVLESTGLLQVGPGPGVSVVAIVDSTLVGIAKPDPRIFEHALALVGTEASRAIHVGDAYQYDVRGARAAGVRPILVDPFDLRTEVDCERVADLVQVASLLR